MNNTYKVTVNGEHEFEPSRDELTALDSVATSKSSFHILKNKVSYKADLITSNFSKKTYQVQINGNTYEVCIADKMDILIKEMGFTVGTSKQFNDLISPMPGLIIDVKVSVGQEVKEGDALVVLSAMKMENSFVANADGVIKAVHVAIEDAVDKGQLLVEFKEN